MMDLRTRTLGLQTALSASRRRERTAPSSWPPRGSPRHSPPRSNAERRSRGVSRVVSHARGGAASRREHRGRLRGDERRRVRVPRRAPELFVAARVLRVLSSRRAARGPRDGEGRGRGRPTTRLRGPRRARDARRGRLSRRRPRRARAREAALEAALEARDRLLERRLETARVSAAAATLRERLDGFEDNLPTPSNLASGTPQDPPSCVSFGGVVDVVERSLEPVRAFCASRAPRRRGALHVFRRLLSMKTQTS